MSDKKQSVGGAWIRQSKSGDQFFSISIGDKKYTMFKNSYKKGKEPDYRLFEDTWKPEVKVDNMFYDGNSEKISSDLPF